MPDAILGRCGPPSPRSGRGPADPAPVGRRRWPRDGRRARVRALLSVANRDGIADLARELRALGVEMYATDGTREALAARRDRGRVGHRAHRRPAHGRRPGQDVPSRGLRGDPRPARRPGAARRARGPGHRPHRPRRRQRQAVRAGHRRQAHRHRRGDRDDRRRGGGPPGCRGPQRGRRDGRLRSRALPDDRRASCRRYGGVSPEVRARLAAEAFSTVAAYHAEIAAYLNQIAGNIFPSRLSLVLEKVDDLRYGENPHQRGRVLSRDDAPPRDARRRRPAPGRPAVVQQPARPRRRVSHRPRLHGADRRHRQAHRSGRAWPRTTSSSRPTGTPSRPTRSPRSAASSASTASSTGRRPGRSPRTRTRRSSPRASARRRIGILRGKAGLELLVDPARPDRGDARLRHRQPRLQAHRRRPPRRERGRPRAWTAASSRS